MVENPEASRMVLDEARDAWEYHASGMGWQKWLAIGRGLQECQRLALERAKANDMKSAAARKAMGSILAAERLDRIDKADRSRLLEVMVQLPAITTWLDTLTTTERMRYNHPRMVLAHFKTATKVSLPDSGAAAAPAPRSYKTAYQAAEAEITELKQRAKIEGRLFNFKSDTPDQIALAVVDYVDVRRAEHIAHALLKIVGERQQPACPSSGMNHEH